MTVYEQLVNAIESGKRVSISLNTKTAWINKKPIVDKGQFKGEYGVTPLNAKEMVEILYESYFNSIPSTRSSKRKSYFIAQDFEQIPMKKLVESEDRVVAQVKLEAYVLGLILSGCGFDVFDTNKKHWFWQSPKNKKLIIQRKWFEE
jgi:hypothetical protein